MQPEDLVALLKRGTECSLLQNKPCTAPVRNLLIQWDITAFCAEQNNTRVVTEGD